MKFLFLAFATSVLAKPLWTTSTIISDEELAENRAKGLRLIQTGPSDVVHPVWKTEEDVFNLIRAKIGFYDVTETYEDNVAIEAALKSKSDVQRTEWPPVTQQKTVKGTIAKLSITQMSAWLGELTIYKNRYYQTTTGAAASDMLYSTMKAMVAKRGDIRVRQYTHPSWLQKSVILSFAGTSSNSSITIIGCHIDSINQASPTKGVAPGADDNGSGCVNLMDTVRSLVAYGYQPVTPLEFHWYSAEEVGLKGSQAIANDYIKSGKKVKAYINLDMTGYFRPGSTEVVALVDDLVDPTLNEYLRELIATYLTIPAGSDHCGYPCSDHASWTAKGVPAAFPFEAPTVDENPNMHTPQDTVSVAGWSWTHSLEFAKLAVAVAVELTAL